MEILLILSLSVMLSRLMYGSQSDTGEVAPRERVVDKLAKMPVRERSFAIAKIMIAVLAFVALIILVFKLPEMISRTAETLVRISNH